jgi:hypothetical protein
VARGRRLGDDAGESMRFRANHLRPLVLDERVECGDRAAGVEHRLLLVQEQLGEPPQRVAAQGEARAEWCAIHLQVAHRLDPRVGVLLRPLFLHRLEIREQVDAPQARPAVDVYRDHRRSPRNVSSIAASTCVVSTPSRQSGV